MPESFTKGQQIAQLQGRPLVCFDETPVQLIGEVRRPGHPGTSFAFAHALIPTTLKLTTLGSRNIGWPFNFEADILSKTIISWLERREQKT